MSNYTIAEIDLSIFKKNMQIIRSIINDVKLLNIVKANAYGHGLVEISKASEQFGADALGVANVEEGIKIREAGVKLPILVLFQHFKDESDLVCKYNLSPIISNDECLEYYDRFLKQNGGSLNLYIKVDTGLNRMGAKPEEVVPLAKKILSYDTLNIEGINTHYAASDMNDDYSVNFTNKQIKIFHDVLNNLKENGIEIKNAHTSNSAAIISYKNTYFDMVRAGIILYGYNDNILGIKPILNLKSYVVLVRNIKKGESISYGMTWTASKDTRVAVIPIGYADGIPRKLSNNWEVKINGRYYPLRGRVCMDSIIAEIGNDNIKTGDEVLIFGNDKKLNADTLASRIDTISHEILVNIGERVKRVYKY
ncbi:alanine racemase [Brachyspira hampsonii]|uniref:Alanine racemase n=2 Tax=Brachyspira hampsonii TaxID=1287055 RepID=A0AAC9XKZ6_9SPIR|nr:alanine racemase [Brachyspira hampsonii]ASJ21344.1 alanine racemase [Brachyspira hampsonii]ELV06081.1 alanine racemase [Brachyspira hampsonii 30599]MBW5410394.1 alanine racemase [Brachyspira hampsonii]OEJ17199.1 alanine racemase [Brachyspira hampsonii]